jgi:hypothetical protein
MLFTCGEEGRARAVALVVLGSHPVWALGDRPSVPHPQVVEDVADKSDIADPALQGALPQPLPGLVLLLQPVEESSPEDTLACLFTLCL